MPALGGSKTEQNLKDAFAGESQANRRYLYFARKADVEGHNDVSALFRSTAEGRDRPRPRPSRLPGRDRRSGHRQAHRADRGQSGGCRGRRDPRVHRHVSRHGAHRPRRGLRRDRRLVRDPGEGGKIPRRALPEGARRARLSPSRPTTATVAARATALGRGGRAPAVLRAGQAKHLGESQVDAGRAEGLQVARARVLAEHGGDPAGRVMAGHGDVAA